ncbi:MAG: hypothetical protein HRT47_12085 [Candidatus Caenarcaniphilales bacterium]|nr:hypothetical protein [Candidatus Caenarcaniphilales bacterium]
MGKGTQEDDLGLSRSQQEDLNSVNNYIEDFVKGNAKNLYPLDQSELKDINNIIKKTSNPSFGLALIEQYSGPRDKFKDLLQWHMGRLDKARITEKVDVEDYINFPKFSDVNEIWGKYKNDGWNASFDIQRLGSENYSAQIFPESKEVIFRPGPSDEPLPLTYAEEILHLEAINLIENNQRKINKWLQNEIGEGLHEGILKDMGHERHHWLAKVSIDKLFEDTVDPLLVERIKVFLIEKDAMVKKLDLYASLIEEKPEFKTKFWDKLISSDNPKAEISKILNQSPRFNLPNEFLEKIENRSLEDVIEGINGKFIEVRKATEFTMPEEETILNSTPKWFAKMPIQPDDYVRDYASTMTREEVEILKSFLEQDWVISDPYKVQCNFDGSYPELVPEENGSGFFRNNDTHNMLSVNTNRESGLDMLKIADERFKTNHSWTILLKMLDTLEPNPDTGSYYGTVNSVSKLAGDLVETQSDSIKVFFNKLNESKLKNGYLSDLNSGSQINALLKKSISLQESDRPAPELVADICNEHIDLHYNKSQYSSANDPFMHKFVADIMKNNAYDYFSSIGLNSYAEKFKDG